MRQSVSNALSKQGNLRLRNKVDVFITLRGDLEHSAIDDLDPSIELAGGEYDVEVGEVEHNARR